MDVFIPPNPSLSFSFSLSLFLSTFVLDFSAFFSSFLGVLIFPFPLTAFDAVAPLTLSAGALHRVKYYESCKYAICEVQKWNVDGTIIRQFKVFLEVHLTNTERQSSLLSIYTDMICESWNSTI